MAAVQGHKVGNTGSITVTETPLTTSVVNAHVYHWEFDWQSDYERDEGFSDTGLGKKWYRTFYEVTGRLMVEFTGLPFTSAVGTPGALMHAEGTASATLLLIERTSATYGGEVLFDMSGVTVDRRSGSKNSLVLPFRNQGDWLETYAA